MVDCNVHPAKLEVRFEDEQKVFKSVYHAIKSKNEDIIEKSKNQEESIENKIPKIEFKEEEFKPRAGTFSGFFKKFLNDKTNEKKSENTLVEDLFQAKSSNMLSWGSFSDENKAKENEENLKEKQAHKIENNVYENSEDFYKNKQENKIEILVDNKEEEKSQILVDNNKEDKIQILNDNDKEEQAFTDSNKEEIQVLDDNNKKEEIHALDSDNKEIEILNDNSKEEKKSQNLDDYKKEEKQVLDNKIEILVSNKQEEEKTEIFVNDSKEEKLQEIKLGNTTISSDTKESEYDINDILNMKNKDETVKIDTTNIFYENNSKTEIVDSLKEIDKQNYSNTVNIDTKNVRKDVTEEKKEKNENIENIEENVIDTVTEKLLEQKAKNYMDATQFIDTGQVRSELYKLQSESPPINKDFANMYKKVFGMETSTVRRTREEENTKLDLSNNIQVADNIENKNIFQEISQDKSNIKYRFIGTIFEDYAIIEVKDEMYMIEKNAAEERLMYEVVKNNFYDRKCYDSVTLLLADIVTLSPKEMSIARDLLRMFRRAGFDYDEFGECTLKLIKVPEWAERLNTKRLFIEILKEMDTVAVTDIKEKEEKFIVTVSSKYVFLANTKLDEKELEMLIRQLLNLPSPFMYPNGRLTAVKISKANMERKFGRR